MQEKAENNEQHRSRLLEERQIYLVGWGVFVVPVAEGSAGTG